MFDFIPVEFYSDLWYHFILLCTVFLSFFILSKDISDFEIKNLSSNFGLGFVILIIFYMGSRLPSYHFGDTGNYNKAYTYLQNGGELEIEKDYIFNYFMIVCSRIMTVRQFLFIDALIYIVPVYLFCKKYLSNYWFYGFFICVASFSFWPYGVNGIRNGMATSIFIMGLVYYEKKWLMYSLFGLSFGVHNSLIVPIAAFVVSGFYKNPKVSFYIWLASIPLSLLGGSFWGTFFTSLGLGDERAESYLDVNAITELAASEGTQFSQTGFRWDFVLYSSMGVYCGWFFIIRKKIQDRFYIHLWSIYLIANAFWILVIRAAFSNRFAYLSWFLLAPIIIYPLFKYRFSKVQNTIISVIMAFYYLFTYFMFIKD